MADGFRQIVRDLVSVPSLARRVRMLQGQMTPIVRQIGELQSEAAALTSQGEELKGALKNYTPRISEGQKEVQALKVQYSQDPALLGLPHERAVVAGPKRFSDEVLRCRDISGQALFVLGFARSSTSISTQILNSSNDVFLLGEANIYLPHYERRFTDWYNQMHSDSNNQISKTTYAPDFVPDVDHDWLDWLCVAKTVYPLVGDKMAFSDQHFSLAAPSTIRSFFESRFFRSKYIFTIRDPVQTLLSTAKLFNISTERAIIRETIAWLRFVQMWADWVRVFPSTLTFDADKLNHNVIDDLQTFVETDLSGAKLFIDERSRTNHLNAIAFPILDQIKDDLGLVFDLVKAAMEERPSQWQLNGEHRPGPSSDTSDASSSQYRPAQVSKAPIYSAWAMCERMIRNLQLHLGSDIPTPSG
jgi:hypothetical protein